MYALDSVGGVGGSVDTRIGFGLSKSRRKRGSVDMWVGVSTQFCCDNSTTCKLCRLVPAFLLHPNSHQIEDAKNFQQ